MNESGTELVNFTENLEEDQSLIPSPNPQQQQQTKIIQKTEEKMKKKIRKKKKKKKKCKSIFNIIFKILYLFWIGILISYAQLIWQKSLETCNSDLILCLKGLKIKFVTILKYILVYGFIHFYIFTHSFILKTKFLKYTGISISVLSFGIRLFGSHGISAEDHSFGNVVIASLVIITSALIFACLISTVKIFLRNFLLGILWIFGFCLLLYFIYWVKVIRSCENLNISLDPRVEYSDEGKECKWFKPKVCWHYAVDGIFRPFYIGRSSCKTVKSNLLEHKKIAGDKKILAYPDILDYDYDTIMHQFQLQEKVNKDIKAVDEEEFLKGDKEVFIDFRSKDEGELVLKVRDLTKKNSKVKQEVKNLDNENLNILRIFIDTVSRNNFHRKYKKTLKFLKKYHYLKKKDKRVYEFFRLHSIKSWTFPNLFASTYGRDFEGWSETNLTRIHTYARKKGYITGFTSDCCVVSESETKGDSAPLSFNDFQQPHHMFFQIACDYNNFPKINPLSFGLGKGPYTVNRNCFMKKDLSSISLDYMHEFFNTYKTKRKMFSARLITAHEFTGENSRFLDPILAKSLERLDREGHLENTIVHLYSDHGDHIDFFLWSTQSGESEMMNPFMFEIIPKKLAEKENVEKNLIENQQKMFTHYNLFSTDLKYLGLKADDKVIMKPSLFYDILSDENDCISERVTEYCKCKFRENQREDEKRRENMASYFDLTRPFVNQEHILFDITVSSIILSPFERLKVLLQTSNKNAKLKLKKKILGKNFRTLNTILKKEGFLSLWRGFPVTVLTLSLYSKIPSGLEMKNMDEFVSYSNLKQTNNKPLLDWTTPFDFSSSIMGTIVHSTFWFTLIFHPLCLIKYNQMFHIKDNKSAKSPGFFVTMVKVYRRSHNLYSFYRGFWVNYLSLLSSCFLIVGVNARYQRLIEDENTDELVFLKLFNFFNFSLFYIFDSYAKNRMVFSDLDRNVYKRESIFQFKDEIFFRLWKGKGVKKFFGFLRYQGLFGAYKGWSSMMIAMGLMYSIDQNLDHIQDKTQNWI